MSYRKIISLCLILESAAAASDQELCDLAATSGQKITGSDESETLLTNLEGGPYNLVEQRPTVVIYDAPPNRTIGNQDGFFCSEHGKSLVISFGIIAGLYGITYGILRLVS